MPHYIYTAMDAKGRAQKGKLEAANETEAVNAIKAKGMFPSDLKEFTPKAKGSLLGGKKAPVKKTSTKSKKGGFDINNISFGPTVIKTKDLTVLTRQIAILLGAGLPLIRSLRTLEKQAKKPEIKKILDQTAETIEGGSTFAEALALNPKTFDKLYLNMVKAGEASGALEIILDRLAFFMEKSARIKGKVKSALVYPIVILSVATIVVVGLMILIVPNFKKIFNELLEGEPLPQLTQVCLGFSDMLINDWHIPIIAIFATIIFFKVLNKFHKGKYALDFVKYNMPLFGPIVSRSAIARFSRTLGTLMSSGVPVLQALNIVKDTSGNEVVATGIQKVHDAVKEGDGIAEPLSGTKIFPQMVVSMVEVGEETGKLPEMMDKIADTYEEEVDNAVSGLTSMLEPLMIVGLAVVVGSIVCALFMPLTRIIEKLG